MISERREASTLVQVQDVREIKGWTLKTMLHDFNFTIKNIRFKLILAFNNICLS